MNRAGIAGGQEDRLGALGFITNVCILWNTVYTARALDEIRAEGRQIASADIARLSPPGFDHLNFLGRHHFSLPETIRDGRLRPLHAVRRLNRGRPPTLAPASSPLHRTLTRSPSTRAVGGVSLRTLPAKAGRSGSRTERHPRSRNV